MLYTDADCRPPHPWIDCGLLADYDFRNMSEKHPEEPMALPPGPALEASVMMSKLALQEAADIVVASAREWREAAQQVARG